MDKVIPQVEFDKSVQKILALGTSRTVAENIVIVLWKASLSLNLDFKLMFESAIKSGQLDVEQNILDYINKLLPTTIGYYKKFPKTIPTIVTREF